jgi:drug/metabolite transporter (DMT)-like permease
MEYLRRSLFLDITAKGLGLIGVGLMIFGHNGWFTVGVVLVVIGVLVGGWSMIAARRLRRREWDGVNPDGMG